MGEVHCDGRRRAYCEQAFLELAVDCARLRLCSCQRRARYAGYSVAILPMENPTTATAFRPPKLYLKTASFRRWHGCAVHRMFFVPSGVLCDIEPNDLHRHLRVQVVVTTITLLIATVESIVAGRAPSLMRDLIHPHLGVSALYLAQRPELHDRPRSRGAVEHAIARDVSPNAHRRREPLADPR